MVVISYKQGDTKEVNQETHEVKTANFQLGFVKWAPIRLTNIHRPVI
jgi:hypothetical protein